LAVETERRNALEQIPMRQIEDISLQIATWLRLAFEQFLGSESPGLMAIKDLGEFKFSAIDRFKGLLQQETCPSRPVQLRARVAARPPLPNLIRKFRQLH
jgi:hypothetical protein